MGEFVKFDERLIGDGYEYTIGVSAVDLTGSGSLDLVSTDTGVGLYWYENDGAGNFTKHVVHRRAGEWLERHAVADINGDGKPEIVNIDNISGSVLWFEFDGDPRRAESWSHHYICEGGLPGAYDVEVADYDGDGELEVVASSWIKGNRFSYFDRAAASGARRSSTRTSPRPAWCGPRTSTATDAWTWWAPPQARTCWPGTRTRGTRRAAPGPDTSSTTLK